MTDFCSHGITIKGIKQCIGIVDDFRQTGITCPDHRGAARHGLKGWKPKAFMPGRKDENSAKAIQGCQCFIADITGEHQLIITEFAIFSPIAEQCFVPAVQTPRNDQSRCRAYLGIQTCVGFYQSREILAVVRASGSSWQIR